jgi:hypothetical protein
MIRPSATAASAVFAWAAAVKRARRRFWPEIAVAQEPLRAYDRDRFKFCLKCAAQVGLRLPEFGQDLSIEEAMMNDLDAGGATKANFRATIANTP